MSLPDCIGALLSASVEGVFRILDRATPTLDRIERKTKSLDRTLDKAGRRLDEFGKKAEKDMRVAEDGTNRFTKANEKMAGKVSGSMAAMSRAIGRSTSSAQRDLGKLQTQMASVDAQRVNPEVDVDVTAAMVQLKMLQAEIRKTNDMGIHVGSSGPSVNRNNRNNRGGVMSWIFGWMSQQAMSFAQRKATEATNRLMDRVWGGIGNRIKKYFGRGATEPIEEVNDAIAATPGLFNRAGTAIAGFTMQIGPMAAKLAGLGTILESVLAGLMAVTGSLGSGALGAGVGLTGILGAGAVGGAGILGGIIPVAKNISESKDALEKYTDAIKKYGRASKEAAEARKIYNRTDEDARKILGKWQNMTKQFKAGTSPARNSISGAFNNSIGQMNSRWRPDAEAITNQASAGFATGTDSFWKELDSPNMHRNLKILSSTFADVMPETGRIFANIAKAVSNIAAAARPETIEFFKWFDQWMEDADNNTSNLSKMDKLFKTWTGDFKVWMGFFGEFGRFFTTLLGAGRSQGTDMIRDLTKEMEAQRKVWETPMGQQGLDSWYDKQVSNFRKLTREIMSLVEAIAQLINSLSAALGPILDLSQGVRNAVPGNSILDNVASTAVLAGGWFGAKAIGRGAIGKVVGTGAAEAGATTAATTAAASSGKFRKFAGKAALPVAAVLAALDFATANGGPGGMEDNASYRAQKTLSDFTLGIIPTPKSAAEMSAQGIAQQNTVGRRIALRNNESVAGLSRTGRGLSREASLLGLAQQHFSAADLQILAGSRADYGKGPQSLRGIKAAEGKKFSDKTWQGFQAMAANPRLEKLSQLEDEVIDARIKALHKQQKLIKRSKLDATLYDVQSAQDINLANDNSVRGWKYNQRQLHGKQMAAIGDPVKNPNRSKQVTEDLLAPLKDAAKQNPKLQKLYQTMVDDVQNRWANMGQKIKVVNGQVFTGTQKEWKGIQDNITSATEKARQHANDDFTAIQRQALGSLQAMGYSASEAKQMVGNSDATGRGVSTGHRAAPPSARGGSGGAGAQGGGSRSAMGGRIPGHGRQDKTDLGGGHIGAPGEAYIANRHTEQRLDNMLAPYNTSLSNEIKNETKPHFAPLDNRAFHSRGHAGGRSRSIRAAASTHPELSPQMQALEAKLAAKGFTAGSTTGGVHAPNSNHYSGSAIDYGDATNDMQKLWSVLRPQASAFEELFGPSSLTPGPTLMHNGVGFSDPTLQSQHEDHIHVADTGGPAARLGRAGRFSSTGGVGNAPAQRVHLKSPRARQKGLPGAMNQASNDMLTKGLEAHVNKKLRRRSGGGSAAGVSGNAVPAQIARVLLSHGVNRIGTAGIIGNAYAESSFNTGATGYGGGGLWGFTASPNSLADLQAYGGANWTDPAVQTKFLLKHVAGSTIQAINAASSPEQAAEIFMTQFERPGIPRLDVRQQAARDAFSAGYFGKGGRMSNAGNYANGGKFSVDRPTYFKAGEAGREDVVIKPANKGSSRRKGGGGGVTVHIANINNHRRGDIEKILKQEFEKLGIELDTIVEDEDALV